MKLTAAFEKLDKDCKKIENMGAINNSDKSIQFSLFKPVIQDYLDIVKHTDSSDPIFVSAQAKLVALASKNADFKSVITSVIKLPEGDNKVMYSYIDRRGLINLVNHLVSEFKKMQIDGFDNEKVGDLEFELFECRRLLTENKNKLLPEELIKSNQIVELLLVQIDRYKSMNMKAIPENNTKGYSFVWFMLLLSTITVIGAIILGTLLK